MKTAVDLAVSGAYAWLAYDLYLSNRPGRRVGVCCYTFVAVVFFAGVFR